MGMSGGGGTPGRTTLSEINVTPMVDVMLVLLIIFMVTAPLIQQGVKVNLPETKAAPVESNEKKIVLSVELLGKPGPVEAVKKKVYIGETEVKLFCDAFADVMDDASRGSGLMWDFGRSLIKQAVRR